MASRLKVKQLLCKNLRMFAAIRTLHVAGTMQVDRPLNSLEGTEESATGRRTQSGLFSTGCCNHTVQQYLNKVNCS